MSRSQIEIPSCRDCTNSTSIFCCLSPENKDLLSDRKGDNFYKKGQVIFYEGNHANGLYCVFNGKVKLSKLGSDGKEQIVRFSKTGDVIGYRALLGDEPYQATATAMEDAHICLLSKEKFFQLMSENPKLSLSVIQLLSKDLKSAEQLLLDVAQKSVKERVAEALVLLKNTFGYQEDQQTLNVLLTRSEIADMVGSTTETTIRTLSQLSDEGVVSLSGKKILIKDIKKLLYYSNAYD
jgi:CRP/FNR family transcriptional regulator, polysaccharide utilization system transcription regulator